MTDQAKQLINRARTLRKERERLRAQVWGKRTDEDKANGTGWVNLDYVAMNRIDELSEEIESVEQGAA